MPLAGAIQTLGYCFVHVPKRAFWTGDISGKAGALARERGFHTLEQTIGGQLSIGASAVMKFAGKSPKNLWTFTSTRYAQGASDTAPVFYNINTTFSQGYHFINDELPVLISNGVTREYYAVW